MTNKFTALLIIAPLALGAIPALSQGSHDINPFDSQPYATNAPTPAPTDAYSGNPIVDCEAQGMVTAEDFSCVPQSFYEVPAEPAEDDPDFDCRIHGNHICGVEVEGTWYLLDYDTMTFVTR